MPARRCSSDGVQSAVVRTPVVLRYEWLIFRTTQELTGSEVIKRSDREHEMRPHSVHPAQEHKGISLLCGISDTCIISLLIVRDLIVVSLERKIEAKLVGPAVVEDQVGKAADSMSLVVQYVRSRRGESVIGANAVQARVVGESLRVIGEADEVIREVKVSVDEGQLTFSVAAETGAWDNTEEAVSPITVLYGVTPALCLQVVNVVYVEGRADVHTCVCIGDWYAVHKPRHLMSSVYVQNVVDQVRAGYVTRNYPSATRARGSRRRSNLFLAYERGRSRRLGADLFRGRRDLHIRFDGRDLELKTYLRRTS